VAAGAILLGVIWVVYFVATRPKNTIAEDAGRKALQDAVAKLMESTKNSKAAEAAD
jgi:hypothetical protein